jgi:hypothetical protein
MHPILKNIVQSHIDCEVYELYDKFDEPTLLEFHERLIANRKEYDKKYEKFLNREFDDMLVAYMELSDLDKEYKDKKIVITGYLNRQELKEYSEYLDTLCKK